MSQSQLEPIAPKPVGKLRAFRRRVGLLLIVSVVLVIVHYVRTSPRRQAVANVAKLRGWTSQEKSMWIPIINNGYSYGPITTLVLNQPSITDADVIPILCGLPDLTRVHLDACGVTDETLKHLEGRPMESFSLMNSQITDEGMKSLGTFSSLDWINVSGTQVGDAGLAALKQVRYSRRLDLGGTRITDAGLIDYAKAGTSALIIVTDTAVTPAGIAAATKINPGLRIE